MTQHTHKFLANPHPGAEPPQPTWADEGWSDEHVAKLLTISTDTLERLRRRGLFPPADLRLGTGTRRRKNVTFRSTFLKWLEASRNRAGD